MPHIWLPLFILFNGYNPPTIRRQDSNPRPFGCKPSPLTTRPWLFAFQNEDSFFSCCLAVEQSINAIYYHNQVFYSIRAIYYNNKVFYKWKFINRMSPSASKAVSNFTVHCIAVNRSSKKVAKLTKFIFQATKNDR